MLDDRLELGAEVIASLDRHRQASAASASLKQGILVYSCHEGLFAGAALKGAVVTRTTS